VSDSDRVPADRVRIDKWLWAARFFKTRSIAAEAIDGGKVEVNGERAKRSKLLQTGDEVRVRIGPYEHVVLVRAIAERRGSATIAAGLYEETQQSRAARERIAAQMKALPSLFGQGSRPSKKDRRDLRRLHGDEGM
jgi:ribosome-associated heat shock protein Hsp15